MALGATGGPHLGETSAHAPYERAKHSWAGWPDRTVAHETNTATLMSRVVRAERANTVRSIVVLAVLVVVEEISVSIVALHEVDRDDDSCQECADNELHALPRERTLSDAQTQISGSGRHSDSRPAALNPKQAAA